ncbi:hypothetical protein [Peribacillus acanthi]|uniref:hypothetical protein n=1 Tax=Peribacillus acanthi TaxID=2171554 RepID=UPI000D3E8062|nr:hypothetical protein [Peribacillus acanthi]
MAKRTQKHDGDQKNKQGFNAAVTDSEFGQEMGSEVANQLHKEKAKKARKSNAMAQKMND